MNNDVYEADFGLWSEQQADALRRRAANEVDWDNVAEEIDAVGRSERNAVASHLVLALLHDLKAEAWPLSRDVKLAGGGARPSGRRAPAFLAVDGAAAGRRRAVSRGVGPDAGGGGRDAAAAGSAGLPGDARGAAGAARAEIGRHKPHSAICDAMSIVTARKPGKKCAEAEISAEEHQHRGDAADQLAHTVFAKATADEPTPPRGKSKRQPRT